MARARNRPPRLESRVGEVLPAPASTPAQLLERAKVAGAANGPGRTELRRFVERIAGGDRAALGELAPFTNLTIIDAWAAFTSVFGATADAPGIDAERTLQAAHDARRRICEVSLTGGRIAFATAAPASLLALHGAIVRFALAAGAEVADLADTGPLRIDGRAPRYLRWIEGVAVVSDGTALCPTRDGEAGREWLFVHPRPALVVADGPFAEVAWEAGLEVVAFASLARGALAIPAARGDRCIVLPMRTDRAPRAYATMAAVFSAPGARPDGPEAPKL